MLDVVQVEHPDAHLDVVVARYGSELVARRLVWPDERGDRPWCAEFSNGGCGSPCSAFESARRTNEIDANATTRRNGPRRRRSR